MFLFLPIVENISILFRPEEPSVHVEEPGYQVLRGAFAPLSNFNLNINADLRRDKAVKIRFTFLVAKI